MSYCGLYDIYEIPIERRHLFKQCLITFIYNTVFISCACDQCHKDTIIYQCQSQFTMDSKDHVLLAGKQMSQSEERSMCDYVTFDVKERDCSETKIIQPRSSLKHRWGSQVEKSN